jgi:hypothetical protein
VEKVVELVDKPILCHMRWHGQDIFILSVNPRRYFAQNFSLMVLPPANNKQTDVKRVASVSCHINYATDTFNIVFFNKEGKHGKLF